jgi:adenosylmethionine-8-amino-7-oxononanoate aminotransferase
LGGPVVRQIMVGKERPEDGPMEVDHDALQRQAHEHLLLHFARNGAFGPGGVELLVLERGEGPYVFDTRGNRYLDGLSSLFCAQIGYSHAPEMAAAAKDQLERLAFNTNWATAHPAAIELASRLAGLAPEGIDHAFFTNGGSESVEAAWKIVRQYHVAKGEPERTKAIARRTAYHGATLGALALTGVEPIREPFGPPAIPVRHVATTNAFRRAEQGAQLLATLLGEIEEVIRQEGPESVAMLIAEPVQNSGGCIVPPEGYWQGLREICDRHGILLVADEVITGFGRLGEWFGVTRFGATPDLITMAKGIASAYAPIGAVMVSSRVAEPLFDSARTLLHGITFGGHPLSAALALRNIEIFVRDGILENVRSNEAYLEKRLRELTSIPIVGDVRGAGYFWAIELVPDANAGRFDAEQREELLRRFLPRRLLEAGLIARADDRGDSVLTLAPPLISDRVILDELVDKTASVLGDAASHMGVSALAGAA